MTFRPCRTAGQDKTTKLWNLDNGTLLKNHTHTASFSTASLLPYSSDVWRTLDDSGLLILWSSSAKQTARLPPRTSPVASSFVHNPSNYLVAIAEKKDVTIWQEFQIATSKQVTSFQNANDVTLMAWSPDGDWMAVAMSDNRVQLWQTTFSETTQGKRDITVQFKKVGPPIPLFKKILALAWHPNSRWLAVPTGESGQFRLLEVVEGRSGFSISGKNVTVSGYNSNVSHAAFHPNGTLLMLGNNTGALTTARFLDANNKPAPSQLQAITVLGIQHTQPITHMKWSPGGQTLVTTGQDNQLIVWQCK